MRTTAQLARLVAPAGWVWVNTPTLRTTGKLQWDNGQQITAQSYPGAIQRLYEFAMENDLGMTPANSTYIYHNYDDYAVVNLWKVTANKPELTKESMGDHATKVPCTYCRELIPRGAFNCTHRNCQVRQACQHCGMCGVMTTRVDRRDGRGQVVLCATCAPVCTKCPNRAYKAEYGASFMGLCKDCDPRENCHHCGVWHEKEGMIATSYRDREDYRVCPSCANKYVCETCGTFKKVALTRVQGKRICKGCATEVLEKERSKHEEFEKDELPISGSLLIPSLPERPYRIVSIETEVNGDKDALAGTMYRCGLVRVPEVETYGSRSRNDWPWAAHLKHDGSVTGGELITHCMNLDTQEHADVLMDVLKKLNSLKKMGLVNFQANCGGHIHIDAHNFGMGDVWRLLTIWNYLEDVIYRLAGAGHDYYHRTLVPGHDRANNGRGYAKTPVKGPFGTKGTAGDMIRMQERMTGLNFTPYLQSIGNCGCGSFRRDDGRGCTCDLGKCTIEWRVWNSQGNPRIIHAWIAFMQAMHAYADQGIDPDKEFEEAHPTFAYNSQKYDPANNDKTMERLEWIFRNLVFTDDEKDSLIYAFQQSELKDLPLETLRDIVPGDAFPVKNTPRNPAVRRCPIVVEIPKPGEKPRTSTGRALRDVDLNALLNAQVAGRR